MPSSSQARRYKDRIAFGLCVVCIAIATVPLVSILFEVVVNGAPALSTEFLTSPPGAIGEPGGGIANAIQGTFILLGLTCLIGVPIGVLAGIYLAEFGDNRPGRSLRFLNDVLAEFPSIVIGILAYSLIVATTTIGFSIGPFSIRFSTGIGSFSTIAGAVALSIIMLPIVTRTTEEGHSGRRCGTRDSKMEGDSERGAGCGPRRGCDRGFACCGTSHRGNSALDSDCSGE